MCLLFLAVFGWFSFVFYRVIILYFFVLFAFLPGPPIPMTDNELCLVYL